MTDIVETPVFTPGIYQLEESDVVQGGADGIDNLQAKQLGNRTLYLKQELETLAASMALTAFASTLIASVDAASARGVLDVPSTADVDAAIAALVASSPAALDTLNELAAALGNDANFATTVTNALALKSSILGVQKSAFMVSLAGGTSDAITATYAPGITEVTDGMTLYVRAAAANGITTPTFTPAAGTIAEMTIVKGANAALAIGDVAGAGHWLVLQADLTLGKWVLLNPATGITSFGTIPQNSKQVDYALTLSDAGKHILHPSTDASARTFTIPANAAVAFPIGTAVTFVNQNGAGAVTIAITTDTMRLAGVGSTGNRTLAANGVATALKITPTEWIISGSGVT